MNHRRKLMVAFARRLLIALWRYRADGVVPEGARRRKDLKLKRRNLTPKQKLPRIQNGVHTGDRRLPIRVLPLIW